MNKTVRQALIDEIHYPIPVGKVDNICVKRGLNAEDDFTKEMSETKEYKGALSDCLFSLLQAVNFSESDKSVGNLTDKQMELILSWVNSLRKEIGEPLVDDGKPRVRILH